LNKKYLQNYFLPGSLTWSDNMINFYEKYVVRNFYGHISLIFEFLINGRVQTSKFWLWNFDRKPYTASVTGFSKMKDFEVQLLIIKMGYISISFRDIYFLQKIKFLIVLEFSRVFWKFRDFFSKFRDFFSKFRDFLKF